MKAVILFSTLLISIVTFASDAGNLPVSCRKAVYDRMDEQGIEAEVWGSFTNVNYVHRDLKNPNGTIVTGVAFYKITNAYGDTYLVEVDGNQNPEICTVVK